MRSNRHVPLITGAVALGLSLWLILAFTGWWRWLLAVPLLAFGWVSLKTGLFASEKGVAELTGDGPVSAETERKLRDRL